MAIITLQHIIKSFLNGKRVLHVLNDLELTVEEGEMAAIMGRSGSGKSTLLHILAGLVAMDSGEFLYKGQPLNFKNQNELRTFRNRNIGYIMQNNALLYDRSVYENIALPMYYSTKKHKMADIWHKVNATAKSLSIEDKLDVMPSILSGGEQQRVAIARALVQDAQILLADEPTGALDIETEGEILGLLIELHSLGKTIILITHDENVAAMCQTRYLLEGGKLIKT